MNTFKKKTLLAALTGLAAMGMVGSAQAVSLNPDGLGQVLIYPYYTVRANADGNAYDSLLTVINAKGRGKAVRVRIREGKAGHEVLSFNLYLAPQDVWTAAISANADGAQIATTDTSCTFPNVRASSPISLSNDRFSGANADGESTSLDRTREGYIEIIEMAEIAAGSPTANAIFHATVDGVWAPKNCDAIVDSYGANTNTSPSFADDLKTPTGGLFGNMTLINVNTARAVSYDAVALSGFYKGGDDWGYFGGARVLDTLWFPYGSENPNLSMAFPATSTVFDDEAGVVESTWTGSSWVHEAGALAPRRSVFEPGLDAVSSVLMRSSIINEYNVAEVYAGATDWVITMPTKNLYFDRAVNHLKPRKLFQHEFRAGGSAAVRALMTFYDREYRRRGEGEEGYFMTPCENSYPSLSWAANTFQFQRPGGSGTVFPSSIRENKLPGFDAGWATARICFPATLTSSVAGGVSHVFTGVPVVGFAATLYNNAAVDGGSLGRVWASYVGTVPHRYERNIQ
jgi:hypothetical protein